MRAPAIPKQCETEKVATACSPAGRRHRRRAGVDGQQPVGDVVDQQQPVALGQRGQRRDLVVGGQRAVRVDRVDEADRPRARRDRRRHGVGVEAIAALGPDGHGHGHAAGREDGGRQVEVAGVAEDDLVAGVDRGQQRQREPGLRALGADDLEAAVALAAERARRLVAQRLDQVGRVDVERVGHERGAHRLEGRRGRAVEARQPAEVGPVAGQARGRPRGRARPGSPADQRDRVAVGDVVPHRVVAGLERAPGAASRPRSAPPGAPR